jgi:hypothetical protein
MGASIEFVNCGNMSTFLQDPFLEADDANGMTLRLGIDEEDLKMPVKPFNPGDFYLDPDDVTRGVTLLPDFWPGEHSEMDFDKFAHSDRAWKEEHLFDSEDVAPTLSQDIAEHLSLTTVHLLDSSPFLTANKLLSFFEGVVISEISKVNRRKFTIRAKAILSGNCCETKVRIYQDNSACLVEFQKRAGDTIAFNRMFSLAKEYLQGSGMVSVHTEAISQRDAHIASTPPDQVLAPLFNIIAHNGDVELLAEAASSLAEAVKNPKIAAQMFMPCAVSALQHLQQVDDFRVAYPTSQVLLCCPLVF